MRLLQQVVFGLALLAVQTAYGTSVPAPAMFHIVRNAAFPSAHSVYLDGGLYNGGFNIVTFEALASPPGSLSNANSGLSAGVPRPPGDPFTYVNRLLNADFDDQPATLGWVVLGLRNNATELSFTTARLEGPISTAGQPDGRVFLANLNLAPGGAANVRVQLIDSGVVLTELTALVQVPEPATAGLIGLGVLLGVAARRRTGWG